ncbi:MAG TPA: hypothetical protein V6C58_10675 [Allocoleopsis sp.]
MSLKDLLNSTDPIGVDIDDVVIPFNSHSVPYINKYYSEYLERELKNEDMVINHIEDVQLVRDAGLSKEDIWKVFKIMEYEGVIENIEPHKYCIDSLKILAERKNNKLYFVTARNHHYYNDPQGMTSRWAEKLFIEHGFKPLEIIYNHNKHEVLSTYGITTFIEDNVFNTEKLLEHNCKVILFSNPTNIMNSYDSEKLSDEVFTKKKNAVDKIEFYREQKKLFRVNSWEDILKNLK